jgi:hypothetical protein
VINKTSCFILTSGCGPPVGSLSENSRSSISSLPTCRMFVWCIKCPSASDYTTVHHNLTLYRGGQRIKFPSASDYTIVPHNLTLSRGDQRINCPLASVYTTVPQILTLSRGGQRIKCLSASDYTTVPHNVTLSRGSQRKNVHRPPIIQQFLTT